MKKYYVIRGKDGIGKTTVINKMVEHIVNNSEILGRKIEINASYIFKYNNWYDYNEYVRKNGITPNYNYCYLLELKIEEKTLLLGITTLGDQFADKGFYSNGKFLKSDEIFLDKDKIKRIEETKDDNNKSKKIEDYIKKLVSTSTIANHILNIMAKALKEYNRECDLFILASRLEMMQKVKELFDLFEYECIGEHNKTKFDGNKTYIDEENKRLALSIIEEIFTKLDI